MTELEDVECDQCGYRSTNSSGLRRHMGKKHKNIPQMDGDTAVSDSFADSFMDVPDQSNEKLEELNCQICEKAFALKYNLNVHMASFHEMQWSNAFGRWI